MRHLAVNIALIIAFPRTAVVFSRILFTLLASSAVAKVIMVNDISDRVFLALLTELLLELIVRLLDIQIESRECAAVCFTKGCELPQHL